MFCGYYGLAKTGLDICLRSHVSKDPFTGNMVKRNKHCCKFNDSTVTIFSNPFEGK